MKNVFFFIALCCVLVTACQTESSIVEKESWKSVYQDEGLVGTFVLKNLKTKQVFVYNQGRIDSMYTPASTFKIFNSLVSLQEGVIDETTVIPWDSVERQIDGWNEDMWMTKAFPRSCVWFYQEIARRVGEERMQYWLDTIGYGNQTMGAAIDLFWLEGDLKVSAMQQIDLLEKLNAQELSFDKGIQSRVKELMIADSTAAYRIYAKTGWGMRIDKQIGWYVGIVETENGTWAFANNIDIRSIDDLRFRKDLLYKILKLEEIVP